MRPVSWFLNRAILALAVLSGIAVVLLMLHVVVDVVARSGFGRTLPGTIAIVSNYYMIAIVCLPLAFVDRNNGHISVDVLTGLFPQKVQTSLAGWCYPLTAAVFGLVAYAAWTEAMIQFRSGRFAIEQGVVISTWIGYFAVPFGYGLAAVFVAFRFVTFLAGRRIAPAAAGVEHQVDKVLP